MTLSFDDPIEAQMMPELMIARRAFPVTQDLLSGPILREATDSAQVGWFDTEVCAEMGAIAVVSGEGDLAELVGEIIVVKRHLPREIRGAFVYVLARAAVLEDICLSRRAFLALGPLSSEALDCSVGVIA